MIIKKYRGLGRIHLRTHQLVLNVSPDFSAYYRWWVFKERALKLHPPKYGTHVTIISGKHEGHIVDNNIKYWKKFEGELVEFNYSHTLFNSWDDCTFWIVVKSPKLESLRTEMGLTPLPKWDFHISVGNRKAEVRIPNRS